MMLRGFNLLVLLVYLLSVFSHINRRWNKYFFNTTLNMKITNNKKKLVT
jgi:hypothetical protein